MKIILFLGIVIIMYVYVYIIKKNFEVFLFVKCIMWLIKNVEYCWIWLWIILISCICMIIGLFYLNIFFIICIVYDC